MIYRRTKKIFCVLLIIAAFAGNVFSQVVAVDRHPSLEPLFLPEEVFGTSDNTASKLSADEVFKFSLLFSECPLESSEGQDCLAVFEKIKAEVSGADYMNLEPLERGRAVLKYLYRDFLKTYDFNQTKTNVAIKTGVYNCVSSAILYMAAVKAAGLEVRGQKTSEHAFCSVYVPGSKNGQYKKVDVETTNPYGFNPGSKETIENEEKIRQYYVVPKKYYSNRQEVSDRVFTGLIAGNICSFCIRDNDYIRAVPLGAARYELIKYEQSKAATQVRRDFDVLAGNYVNTETKTSEEFSEIVDWYISFINRWGMTEFLQKNMDNAINNFLYYCLNENNYSFAKAYFETTKKYLTQNQISTSQEIIFDIFFNSEIKYLSAEEQIRKITEILESDDYQSVVYQNRGRQYLENSWIMFLNNFMNNQDYYGGLIQSEDAVKQFPKSAKIQNLRQNFYNNCIALIHNDFADKANDGNYEEARTILEEGLEQFLDDKTLKKDYQILQSLF